jgi:NADH-quinone oxidoreductase subunit F
MPRILDGHGRPEDVALLMDAAHNISVDFMWPPRMTTICPLGQSATTPIASAVMRFPEEFERYVGGPIEVTVPVRGAAFVGPPTRKKEGTGV